MAKKKRQKKKVARRRSPVATAAGGPITLDEAKALAARRRPARARKRGASIAEASPQTVALARRRHAIAVRKENQRRTAEYVATLRLMKQRGVADPKQPPRVRALAPPKVVQPLQVFAEGDSWFKYPVPPSFDEGIIKRLKKLLGVPILNLAVGGDEVRYMLGVKQRKQLIKLFVKGCPAGGRWDAMLFSGGGNDVVHDPMALWVKDFDPNIPIEDHLHAERFDHALALVRAGYEDLIDLRDTLSPTTKLLFHGYDFPLPDGRGECFFGPWLEPTFELRKFPKQVEMRAKVMKTMLLRFASMLAMLARPDDVLIVKTLGTLAPVKASWDNELHPENQGSSSSLSFFRSN